MELALCRQDLLQVGAVSSRGTLKVLPPGKKKKSKLVLGDNTGTVTCVEIKKGTTSSVFRTMPTGVEIQALELGGPAGKKDKIFVSHGQQVRGLTKKGKEFFKFNTSLSDSITTMFVEDSKIWTGAEYVFNTFDNGKDVEFCMCPDRINDLTVDNISRETEYDAILGCNDRMVRVVQGSDPLFDCRLDSAVNSVHRYESKPHEHAPRGYASYKHIVAGGADGSVNLVNLDSGSARRGWSMPSTKASGITDISSIDFTADGVSEIIVTRDDGDVFVYGFDMSPEPQVQFNSSIGESVRSVDVGNVGHADYREMVLCSYSGKVISYTMEPLSAADEDDAYGRSKATVQREGRIKAMRKELDELERKVAKEREKYSKHATEFIPMEQQFHVKDSFVLDPAEAAYKLTLEIPMPIDVVALQSKVGVDLLDADTNDAIVSRTAPHGDSDSLLMATYRCQENMNRLTVALRTIEGQSGELQAMVIAKMAPKTAQIVRIEVKPLSLHHALHGDVDNRPMNSLQFRGGFTMGQMHEWISHCIPGVPSRATGEEVKMAFENSFVGTQLSATYSKGQAVFRSDSVSTIAILKEVITKAATARKVRVDMSFSIEDETIASTLRLLDPMLSYQLSLARKVNLIDALKEIKTDGAMEFLDPEYKEVIEHSEKIRREFKNRPGALAMLYGLVSDMYQDKHKFKGHNVTPHIPELHALLDRYNYDEVLEFISRVPGR